MTMTPSELETFDANAIRYLSLKMTPEQSAEFLATVEASAERKERLSFLALLKKTSILQRMEKSQEIADAIRSLSEDEYMRIVSARPKTKVSIWPRFVRYAAAACVIGLICLIAIPMLKTHPYVDLGNTYDYTLFNTTIDYASNRGNEMYTEDQLREIASLFDNIKSGTSLDKALDKLQVYYNNADTSSEMIEYIAWNLAIGYLKTDKPQQAHKILTEMVDRNEEYEYISEPAKALLDKIEEIGK